MSNTIDTKIISKLAEILDKNQLTNLKYEDESCTYACANLQEVQRQP